MSDPSQQLRLFMRQQRRNISTQQRCRAAAQLAFNIAHHPLLKTAKHVACYLENDGEISLEPLIQRLWQTRKHCYLPVLHPFKRGLLFLPYTPNTRLRNNRFGIAEPCEPHLARRAWALDVVLTPLLAFDQQGHRLGMGGGFYDASFAYLKQRRFCQRPTLLGVAFECQRTLELPHINPWDIPLQGAVTETACYQFASSPKKSTA